MRVVTRLRSRLEGPGGGAWIVLQSVLALLAVTGAQLIIDELSEDHAWGTRVALGAIMVAGALAYFWVALAAARVRDQISRSIPRPCLRCSGNSMMH
jgi:hypothetical protein